MRWSNVKLIFSRELVDQLRDRRTLFTVIVMPLILYPLMGMAMLQVAQFMRQHPSKIWVVGADKLPEEIPLIVKGQIDKRFLSTKNQALVKVTMDPQADEEYETIFETFRSKSNIKRAPQLFDQLIQKELQERDLDVAVFITSNVQVLPGDEPDIVTPEIFVFKNVANDRSRIAAERVDQALSSWRLSFVKNSLSEVGVPLKLAQGFKVTRADVSDKAGKQAAIWSKILPFIVMIWCLTGAFYPAIDLCAGEKERGTFETLLSSPADRSEIAIGKLLTVMAFSMTTSLLNLVSMGVTGSFVAGRLGSTMDMGAGMSFGPPPMASIGWLFLALIPISALFSAIALAAAAFARSSKEGQYYLVPLMMISMPLMMVPMLPGAQLDLGTSLIPVSGLMLLLRGLIESQYAECFRFAGPVCAITLVCCWFSIRWVVYQFNSESVLFRASERVSLGSMVKHVMRERHELPSVGNAVLCAVVILVAKFFLDMAVPPADSFITFAKIAFIILLSAIAVPAVMMAVVLTKNPLKSLRIRSCTFSMACAAVLAAILLNPLFTWFSALVLYLYPPAGDLVAMDQAVSRILGDSPGLWATILVIAACPAIFEEVAYRGFILSGLEGLKSKWKAIVLSSLFFGMAHGVIQQSIMTFGVGIVIGIIAVQTKSLIPCVLFHLTHNSLAVLMTSAKASVIESSPILSQLLVSSDGESFQYAVGPGILMAIAGVLMVMWFVQLNVKPPKSIVARNVKWLVNRLQSPTAS